MKKFVPFSRFFHAFSKDHDFGRFSLPPGSRKEIPEEWKTTYYKTYPRFKKIKLTYGEIDNSFSSLVRGRISRRDLSGRPLAVEDIGTILKYSVGEFVKGEIISRAQPSGGAHYPIETYVITTKPTGKCLPGLYHYGVKDHELSVLWEHRLSKKDISEIFTYHWVQEASCIFVFTGIFRRTTYKYGERGYRYVLLEAGHIGQNVLLAAESLGVRACALGGTKDGVLEKFLDVDGVSESVVYAIAFSK